MMSLLDLHDQENYVATPRVDRILLSGTMRSDATLTSEELGGWAVNFFRSHTRGESASGDLTGSGLLLMHETGALLMVEHGPAAISALLRELAAPTTPLPPLENVRVLACVDDVPSRAFPLFAVRALSLSRAERYSVDLDDPVGIASATYIGLLGLGKALAAAYSRGSEVLSRALDSLRSDDALSPLLPVASMAAVFAEHNDIPFLHEFLQVYSAPFDTALDEETQYPPPNAEWFAPGLVHSSHPAHTPLDPHDS